MLQGSRHCSSLSMHWGMFNKCWCPTRLRSRIWTSWLMPWNYSEKLNLVLYLAWYYLVWVLPLSMCVKPWYAWSRCGKGIIRLISICQGIGFWSISYLKKVKCPPKFIKGKVSTTCISQANNDCFCRKCRLQAFQRNLLQQLALRWTIGERIALLRDSRLTCKGWRHTKLSLSSSQGVLARSRQASYILGAASSWSVVDLLHCSCFCVQLVSQAGDSAPEELATATQVQGQYMPIVHEKPSIELVKVTDEMRSFKAYAKLRVERMNRCQVGARMKKAAEAEKEEKK